MFGRKMSGGNDVVKLSDYIKRASAAGFNTDKILHELLGGGWPVRRAKRAISMYHQKQFTKYLSVFAVFFVAAVFAVKWLPHQFSVTGAFAGIDMFEGNIVVQNESGQITKHIVFSANKPLFCEDGIHIIFGSDEIPFEVQNEVYENGACTETDVVFTVPEQPKLPEPETNETLMNETLPVVAEQIANETILLENQTNETLPENNGTPLENQTEVLLENQTGIPEESPAPEVLNSADETENNLAVPNDMGSITGFAVSEISSEIRIYYGAPEPAPSAEIGEGVQIAYKTDAAPALIILNQDGSITTSGVTKDELRGLAKSAKAIEKDSPVSAFLSDSVPLINATDVWSKRVNGINITGSGNAVCVIDTGIDYGHPDMGGCFGAGCKVLGGYDFVNNDTNPMDDHGHGTHVAGTIAANGVVKGVAPGANLIAIKALDAQGSGTFSNVIAGINWCIGHKAEYNITAVSMSLGTSSLYSGYCDSSYPVIGSVIDDAVSEGISIIVSTGNNGNFTAIASPACVQGAIATGASTKSDAVWGPSNRNSVTDLLAPGENIRSTVLSSGYSTLNGTSMSAPHVAGVIALLQNYEMMENGDMLDVSQVLEAVNSGVSITDAQSGLAFKRVDALYALYSIAPELAQLTITVQSPLNGSYTKSSTVYFNISSNKELSAAFVSIDNGDNITLTGDLVLHHYNASILNESQHSAVFWANDTAGDSASAAVSFSVDLTNPSVVLVSPPENSVVTRGSLINLSIADGVQLSAVVYHTSQNAINTALASPYSINTTSWTNGTLILTVIANDSAGNANQSVFAFTANATSAPQANTPPAITSVSILPATAYKTGDLTCTVSASDADGNSMSYFFTWTNNIVSVSTSNISSASFVLASGNLTKSQNWTCRAKAYDGWDNSTEVSASTVVRNSVPEVSATNPSGVVVSGSVSVNATVTDGDGQTDITSVSFHFRNATGTYLIGSATANTSNSLYSATWNTLATADNGATLIFVNATDGTASTTGTSASNLTVSNVNRAPNATVSYPNGNETLVGSKVINWTASDPDGDALTFAVYYSANSGSTWTSITNSTASYVQLWNTATVSNGTNYRVKVAVTDARGLNASDTSNADFAISNPASAAVAVANNTAISVSSTANYDITQKFTSISASTPISFVINKEGIALTEISITMKSATKGAEIKIKKLSDKTADISIVPSGMPYQYLQIDTINILLNISSATIKFKVPASWVQANLIDPSTVSLKKWTAGAWATLPTTLSSNDSANYYYSTVTPSFSVFAITGNKQILPAVSVEEPPTDESLKAGKSTGLTGQSIFSRQINLNEVLLIVLLSSLVLVSVMYVGMRPPKGPRSPMPLQPYYPQQRQQYPQQPRYYGQKPQQGTYPQVQQQQRQQAPSYPQQPYPQQRQQQMPQNYQRQYYQQTQQPQVPQVPQQQPMQQYSRQQYPQVPQPPRQQYSPQQYPYPAQRVSYPKAQKQNFISQLFNKPKKPEQKKPEKREPPDFGF
ncbi:MAG: S8 family serine peptidase [archaeon]